MSKISYIAKDSNDFLLGLSLAELIIILFFILALLFTITLQEKSQTAKVNAEELASCEVALSSAEEKLALFSTVNSLSASDCASQLVIMKSSNDSYAKTIETQNTLIDSLESEQLILMEQVKEFSSLIDSEGKLTDTTAELLEISEFLLEEDLLTDTVINSVKTLAQQNEQLTNEIEKKTELLDLYDQQLEEASEDPDTKITISELLGNYNDLREDNKDCLIRIESQKKRCGLDYPACWEIENGQPDYVFNVTVTNSGYEVQRSYSDGRSAQAAKIPGVLEMENKTLTTSQFSSEANKIFLWSKERNCRHYVRIFDSDNTTKETYKQRLRRLQSYFYKFEP